MADRRLADKWGWKIGDRIPIKGTYYPFNLDLQLCGTFDSPKEYRFTLVSLEVSG